MNILQICYYYIFPVNSDEYVILDYDKKYNEIIEYIEYSDNIYKTSQIALIKKNVDYFSKELLKYSKIAIKNIGLKLIDFCAEIYYYDYQTIHSIHSIKSNPHYPQLYHNHIRLQPIFKKKYQTRDIDLDEDLSLLPAHPVFQENSCDTQDQLSIQLPLILDTDDDKSDLKRFFEIEDPVEVEKKKQKEQSLDEILRDIIQERKLKNI